MCNARVILCEACGSEGRIRWGSRQFDNYGNEMEHDEPCPYCEGTGGEIIETQPIEMEDLDYV